jgi:hypothetical protein
MRNEGFQDSLSYFFHSSFFIFLLFIAHCSFVIAQDGENRFIQRLTWSEDEYARRYEVVIEKEEEGEYRGLFRELSTVLFIKVPLLPGKYRCQVITHDFLNRPGPVPEWKYIEVLAARDPTAVNTTDDIELVHKTVDGDDKKVNFFLSAAWTPSFTISDGGSRFFERNMSLSGATVRFGVVWERNFFNINPGLELPVSYNGMLTFGLNLLAMKRLPGDRTALTFRLGAGCGILFTDDGAAYINAGVSFLLFVINNWYLETGLDYSHWFTSPASYYFRPWLGIGLPNIF